MVVLDIYKQNLKTVYKTTLISKAAVFVLLTTCLTIILPFIFALKSRGLWLKHDVFYEQPVVKYKGEYMFVGLTNNVSNLVVCNNFQYVEQLSKFDVCSIVKAREVDNNFDSKVDSFELLMQIELPEHEHLVQFTLILPLDYRITSMCPLNMQSSIVLQQFVNNKLSSLNVKANLNLLQRKPLPCFQTRDDRFYDYPVVLSNFEAENYKIENILEEYSKRNLSTYLDQIYTSYESSITKAFQLRLQVYYPEHRIYYTPDFWQLIKWAWMQYIAIYLIVAWFFHKIKDYIFRNNLVLFYKVSPIRKEK